MGSVFKAQDEKLKRDVALKFINGGFSRDDDKKRFIREAQAAASLQHPNICPIYEVDEFQGRIFFVMAYLEGRTLGELIEDGPLPIEQAVNIARQVAAGLEEAHEHGIVHRDIKSSNIIVNGKRPRYLTRLRSRPASRSEPSYRNRRGDGNSALHVA